MDNIEELVSIKNRPDSGVIRSGGGDQPHHHLTSSRGETFGPWRAWRIILILETSLLTLFLFKKKKSTFSLLSYSKQHLS